MGKVPMWVVVYTVLIALLAITLSVPDIGAFGWSAAMRNAAAGFVGLGVVAFARKSPAGYFAAMLARFFVEIGDTIQGALTGDTFTLVFALVVMAFDVAAIYVLFPLLSNEEPTYG